jgi:hypothetical protein
MFASHRDDCVGHSDEDRGMLDEERAKGSELAAHRCVCLGMLEGFGQHSYERGPMPAPFGLTHAAFGAMPDANRQARSVERTASRRVGSHAPPVPRDAPGEGGDAPPASRDAPALPKKALGQFELAAGIP